MKRISSLILSPILSLFVLISVAASSSTSLAQTSQPTPAPRAAQSAWSSLGGLRPGQSIQVLDMAAKKDSGTFLSVSDTAIAFRQAGGEHSIERQNVRSVKLMENTHRLRHTLIGAGVGAGAGAGTTAAGWEDHGFLGGKGVGAAVGAVIGGVSGAIVGAVLPAHGTIYNVSPH